MKHKLLKCIPVIGMVFATFTFGLPVLSADYEWIPFLKGTQSGFCYAFPIRCVFDTRWPLNKNRLKQNTSTNFAWHVSTTGSFLEYRSLYYYTTTDNTFVPPPNWPTWTEVTACRRNGTVSGGVYDTCTALTPVNATTAKIIWYRASTQYGGCAAGYTPTPSVIPDCGGIKQASSTLESGPLSGSEAAWIY